MTRVDKIEVAEAARILKVRVAELKECSRAQKEIRGAIPPKYSGKPSSATFQLKAFLEAFADYLAAPQNHSNRY